MLIKQSKLNYKIKSERSYWSCTFCILDLKLFLFTGVYNFKNWFRNYCCTNGILIKNINLVRFWNQKSSKVKLLVDSTNAITPDTYLRQVKFEIHSRSVLSIISKISSLILKECEYLRNKMPRTIFDSDSENIRNILVKELFYPVKRFTNGRTEWLSEHDDKRDKIFVT